MISTIDLIIRSACFGMCLLMIIHFATMRPVSRKTISMIAMLIGACGLVGISTIIIPDMHPTVILVRTIIVAISPVLIAWGLLELFVDDFRIKPWQIVFVSISIPTHFLMWIDPVFSVICHSTSLMIYLYLFYITMTTSTHDLVEARCRFRQIFMTGAALSGAIFTALHWYYGEVNFPQSLDVVKALVMLALALVLAYFVLKVREHVWALPQNALMKRPDTLSPAETALLGKLQASMKEDIWREEGLTIKRFAELLDAPEHRLRKVINQGLGYRNFSAFVNEHRIGAACDVLADPVKADVPVISIAYEVGYASLGPFNRAFKDIMGESPTEYRKRSFTHA